MNSELLKELSNADSVASVEDEVRSILYRELAKYSDEVLILSFPIRNGTGMIRCNITNVEAVVCLYCRKFFAISYKV